MEEQQLLFSIESMLDIHPLEDFRILFANLKAYHLDSAYVTGRKRFSQQSLLKAIIFKNLNGLSSLTDLAIALKNNPSAAIRCGFNMLRPLPSVQRYSQFLRNKNNSALHKIRIQLAHELISLGLIRGNYLSTDSGPVLAKARENNLKTNVKARFNKERILIKKGDQLLLGLSKPCGNRCQRRTPCMGGYQTCKSARLSHVHSHFRSHAEGVSL